MGVAAHTRIGRLAVQVGGDEWRHDIALELRLFVQHIMRNTESGCRITGIFDIAKRTAGARRGFGAPIAPKFERGSGDVVPGRDQGRGRGRAVHAARHGHQHPSHERSAMASRVSTIAWSPETKPSNSSSVDVLPKLTRTAVRARSGFMPMARST